MVELIVTTALEKKDEWGLSLAGQCIRSQPELSHARWCECGAPQMLSTPLRSGRDNKFTVVARNGSRQKQVTRISSAPPIEGAPSFARRCSVRRVGDHKSIRPQRVGWPTQALCWLEWGSSTAGLSLPTARSRCLAVHSDSSSTVPLQPVA